MKRIRSFLILRAIWVFQPIPNLDQGTNLQKPFQYSSKNRPYLFNGSVCYQINTYINNLNLTIKGLSFSNRATFEMGKERNNSNKFIHTND